MRPQDASTAHFWAFNLLSQSLDNWVMGRLLSFLFVLGSAHCAAATSRQSDSDVHASAFWIQLLSAGFPKPWWYQHQETKNSCEISSYSSAKERVLLPVSFSFQRYGKSLQQIMRTWLYDVTVKSESLRSLWKRPVHPSQQIISHKIVLTFYTRLFGTTAVFFKCFWEVITLGVLLLNSLVDSSRWNMSAMYTTFAVSQMYQISSTVHKLKIEMECWTQQ